MRVKFLDLNIWLGGKLFEPLVNFLRTENADILALQEVHNSHNLNLPKNFRSVDLLKNELKYPHIYFSPCFIKNLDGVRAEQGNVIFSKFPILRKKSLVYNGKFGEYEEKQEHFLIQPRVLQYAEIDLNGTLLNVFNTQGIWGFDGRDSERRIKMGEFIANQTKDKKNVILSGDFNVNPDTKTISIIEENLINVFKNELTSTFNTRWKKDPGFASAVVDMVFVSPDVRVISCASSTSDISDHLPLICEFEV